MDVDLCREATDELAVAPPVDSGYRTFHLQGKPRVVSIYLDRAAVWSSGSVAALEKSIRCVLSKSATEQLRIRPFVAEKCPTSG
ncbi:hypothetical protein BT93_G0411 [Corymbia citriodora subsp. variegata]|nr:hypothetical protein BT93_G0411 [Corymbia citriodora subsp. variegata]